VGAGSWDERALVSFGGCWGGFFIGLRRPGGGSVGRLQPTTIISRAVSFSLRPPSSVTVTMSSIRTPNLPGR
jgi:hypothetical protein